MRLIRPEPPQALLGLRAMKTVASAGGPIGNAQRALMETAKDDVLRIDADIDALQPIDPASFAAGFKDSELRRQFVNGLLVVALADVRPTAGATSVGVLGEPDVAGRMFAALERGGHVAVDLADKWDYWSYVELPLVEARQRLAVPVKSPL